MDREKDTACAVVTSPTDAGTAQGHVSSVNLREQGQIQDCPSSCRSLAGSVAEVFATNPRAWAK